jgi:hypothetical protein
MKLINYIFRLYLATDVPMDYQFRPHLRNEIRFGPQIYSIYDNAILLRKISWFSVCDLPRNKNDEMGCERLRMAPNNFYSVLPFVDNITAFIKREQAERNKLKQTVLKQSGAYPGTGGSAFQAVVPKGFKLGTKSNYSASYFSFIRHRIFEISN